MVEYDYLFGLNLTIKQHLEEGPVDDIVVEAFRDKKQFLKSWF